MSFMTPQLQRLRSAGAGAVPGTLVVKGMQRVAWQVPIISHWGISGGRFPELAGSWADRVQFVQTYSFFGKQGPVGQSVIKALEAKYPDVNLRDEGLILLLVDQMANLALPLADRAR